MKFYDLFFNFMIVGLIIFGMFGFIVSFQSENSVENKFIDDSAINESYGDLISTLDEVGEESEQQKALFDAENPTSGFGTLLLFSVVSTGRVFNSMVIAVFNTIIKLPATFLGLDAAVFSILSALLIASIIIGLWMLYKLGG